MQHTVGAERPCDAFTAIAVRTGHGDQRAVCGGGDGVGLVCVQRVELCAGVGNAVVARAEPDAARLHFDGVRPALPGKAENTVGLIQAHRRPEIDRQGNGIRLQQIGGNVHRVAIIANLLAVFIINGIAVQIGRIDAPVIYCPIKIAAVRFIGKPALYIARAQVLPEEIAVGVIVKRAVPCGERRAGLVVAAIEAFNAFGGRIAAADQMLRRHGKRLVQECIHIIQIVRLALLAVMQRRGEVQHMLELVEER